MVKEVNSAFPDQRSEIDRQGMRKWITSHKFPQGVKRVRLDGTVACVLPSGAYLKWEPGPDQISIIRKDPTKPFTADNMVLLASEKVPFDQLWASKKGRKGDISEEDMALLNWSKLNLSNLVLAGFKPPGADKLGHYHLVEKCWKEVSKCLATTINERPCFPRFSRDDIALWLRRWGCMVCDCDGVAYQVPPERFSMWITLEDKYPNPASFYLMGVIEEGDQSFTRLPWRTQTPCPDWMQKMDPQPPGCSPQHLLSCTLHQKACRLGQRNEFSLDYVDHDSDPPRTPEEMNHYVEKRLLLNPTCHLYGASGTRKEDFYQYWNYTLRQPGGKQIYDKWCRDEPTEDGDALLVYFRDNIRALVEELNL
jgi:hypothetical protein